MSFSVKNGLIDVKLFTPVISPKGPCSLCFFSPAASLPAAFRGQCTLQCSLLYIGSWQCQPSSWLSKISNTLMISGAVSCMQLFTSAWVSKAPHILYVQNPTHWVKTHTISYNSFLVNGITINLEISPLPYFPSHEFGQQILRVLSPHSLNPALLNHLQSPGYPLQFHHSVLSLVPSAWPGPSLST